MSDQKKNKKGGKKSQKSRDGVAHSMDKEFISLVKQVFADFCEANGKILAGRVAEALQVLGTSPLQSQVDNWTKKSKKGLEFEEFLEVLTLCQANCGSVNEQEVGESLKVFDVDGEGLIPLAQLKHIICSPQPGAEAEAMKKDDFDRLMEGIEVVDGNIRYQDLALVLAKQTV